MAAREHHKLRRSPRGIAAGCLMGLALGLLLLLHAVSCRAAPELPALTGRVVDGAGLLSAASQSAIESKLKTLEEKSGIQLVVATVKSLGGDEVEPYANRLFRAWKLGEKTKNNGVLLLVAPTEHKVRIEVGYGLEGTLTDAISKLIIINAMTPRFKANDFQGGIERGVDDIIAVLSTDAAEWQKRPDLQAQQAKQQDDNSLAALLPFLIVIGVIIVIFYMRRRGRAGGMVFLPTGGTGWSSGPRDGGFGGGSGSSGEGGFSGGGGSSGGGGASGEW